MRLHRHEGLHCGTLVYRKDAWARCAGYPDLSFFEQTTFLGRLLATGARLVTVPNRRHYVQIRHDRNTWRDQVFGIAGWRPRPGMSRHALAAARGTPLLSVAAPVTRGAACGLRVHD
jgi:hypothetical protein